MTEGLLQITLFDKLMTRAIIVDLDGTLCDVRHRVHLSTTDKEAFNVAMFEDPINHWCLEIIKKFAKTHEILIVSTRKEMYRWITSHWLKANKVPYHQLYLRGNEDLKKNWQVKEDIYNECIKENYLVEFVLEDRKGATEMWRKNGLICLQCADNQF